MNDNKKGFTLIELLAVIVLLSIILVTAASMTNKIIKKNRAKVFGNDVMSISENVQNMLSGNNNIDLSSELNNTLPDASAYSINVNENATYGIYVLEVKPNISGEFKKVNLADVSEENKNSKFYYDENNNRVCITIRKNGKLINNSSSCKSDSVAVNVEDEYVADSNTIGEGDIPETTTPIINDKVPNIKVEMPDKSSLCTKFTKKETYVVGDIIALCNKKTGKSEDFNVINDNGTNVTMLAMYNLYIKTDGLQDIPYNTNSNDEKEKHVYPLAFTVKDTGHHNRFCSGCYYGYWVDSKGKLLDSKGNLVKNPKYPYYVYNSNSSLQLHIANYVSYIKNELKISGISGRLIKHTELKNLGCSRGDRTCRNSSYKWLYNSSYWTGSAYDAYEVWGVYYGGKYDSNDFYYSGYYQFDNGFGVRPVITINKSEL